MTLALPNSAVATAQNLQTYEFYFVPTGALATNGSVLALARAQAAAAGFAFLCVGNGDNSTAKITAAQMSVLVGKDPSEPAVFPFAPKASELAKVATGLKTFTDEIEALDGSGTENVVFCVGGIEMKDIVCVMLDQIVPSVDTAGAGIARFAGARPNPVKLYEGVITGDTGSDPSVLGSNSKLVKAVAGTEVDLDTDKCIFSPRWKFVAGCFTTGSDVELALAASTVLKLTIVAAV